MSSLPPFPPPVSRSVMLFSPRLTHRTVVGITPDIFSYWPLVNPRGVARHARIGSLCFVFFFFPPFADFFLSFFQVFSLMVATDGTVWSYFLIMALRTPPHTHTLFVIPWLFYIAPDVS